MIMVRAQTKQVLLLTHRTVQRSVPGLREVLLHPGHSGTRSPKYGFQTAMIIGSPGSKNRGAGSSRGASERIWGPDLDVVHRTSHTTFKEAEK